MAIKRRDPLAQKVDRMAINTGKLVKIVEAMDKPVMTVEKVAILELRQDFGDASPDTTATLFTSRTVNFLLSDPSGIIKNPDSFVRTFTGPIDLGANTNKNIVLAPGTYYVKADFLGGARSTTGAIESVLRFYNPQDTLGIDRLASLNNHGANGGTSDSELVPLTVEGYFTITGNANVTCHVQQCASVSGQSTGIDSGFAEQNVYGRVLIKKIEKVSLASILGIES